MGTTVLIKSPLISSDPNLPKLRRDPIWDTAGAGGRFGFDTAFPWSFPAQALPVSGSLVRDTSDLSNGDLFLPAGVSVAFAGNGIDFSTINDEGAVVRGGPGSLASIFAEQNFLITGWAKLPTQANWNKVATLAPIFATSDLFNGYNGGPDLLTVAQTNAPALQFRRQTAGSTVQTLSIANLTPFYGRVCQWAFWRNAEGCGARLRSSAGVETAMAVAGAKNAGDFSGQRPQWGVTKAFNAIPGTPEHSAAARWRLFRGHVEDLAVSGRDPVAVIDRDWQFASGLDRYS